MVELEQIHLVALDLKVKQQLLAHLVQSHQKVVVAVAVGVELVDLQLMVLAVVLEWVVILKHFLALEVNLMEVIHQLQHQVQTNQLEVVELLLMGEMPQEVLVETDQLQVLLDQV